MSKVFDELQAQHIKLLDGYSTQQNPEDFLKKVQAYVEQVQITSQKVNDSRERSQLRANLRYWGSYVFEATGSYPNIELAPASAQSRPWSFKSVVYIAVVILIILSIYGLFIFNKLTTIPVTTTPTLEVTIKPTSSSTPTFETIHGLIVKTSIKCDVGADGTIEAEVVLQPINGTPPYIVPGYDFVDTQTFVAHQGDILQVTVRSSDKPPLTWSDEVKVDCILLDSSVTPRPLPSEIKDERGVQMVLVPAGEFIMGSENSDLDERPVHTVFLSSYYIDKFEVTNAIYKGCVEARACEFPQENDSTNRLNHYGNPEFENHPVIYVTWGMAKAYCEWRGARMPTEAEWEKAARGADERTYPWGNNTPNDRLLSYNSALGDTSPVGSYPEGKSPYGVYDMAGNVSEWTADWYALDYYAIAPIVNPVGAMTGLVRVVRGGSWRSFSFSNDVTVTNRNGFSTSTSGDSLGFRCASAIP